SRLEIQHGAGGHHAIAAAAGLETDGAALSRMAEGLRRRCQAGGGKQSQTAVGAEGDFTPGAARGVDGATDGDGAGIRRQTEGAGAGRAIERDITRADPESAGFKEPALVEDCIEI